MLPAQLSAPGALIMPGARYTAVILFAMLSALTSQGQTVTEQQRTAAQMAFIENREPPSAWSFDTPVPAAPAPPSRPPAAQPQTGLPEAPGAVIIDKNEEVLKQTHRIMGVLPNFTAVDSNTQLPRLTTREKFVVAMHDSVDYSSFLLVAGLAGKGLYSDATPQLGSGAAGYGRYYWREFADQVSGTFFTEAIFPTLTHEDPRYYTLGKHGFFRRATYAMTRTLVTLNDAGGHEFNISEIGGDASEAILSNFYYPSGERGVSKTAKNFGTQIAITSAANVLKEFWPDIRKNVFRMKDAEVAPDQPAPQPGTKAPTE